MSLIQSWVWGLRDIPCLYIWADTHFQFLLSFRGEILWIGFENKMQALQILLVAENMIKLAMIFS